MLLKNQKFFINNRKKISAKKFLDTYILPFESDSWKNKENISEKIDEYLLKIR